MRFLALGLLLIHAPALAGELRFVEVSAAAGIDVVQYQPRARGNCLQHDGRECETERMTGGVAVTDIDQDGWPDLLLTRIDGSPVLMRNAQNGTFEDISQDHGLDAIEVPTNGAAFVDFDRDGDEDLYLTTLTDTRYLLLRLDDDGRFRIVDSPAAVQTEALHNGFSVAVGDYDRDGWPDLHVNEWRPTLLRPTHTRLLHNQEGVFEDATLRAGVDMTEAAANGIFTYTSIFADFDGDGWQDLAVAADFGHSRLFWNQGDGTFADGTAAARVGTDENGMGAAVGDLDNDGDLDWFITAISDPDSECTPRTCTWEQSGNRLYTYQQDRVFADQTGLFGARHGGWGWGAAIADLNSDGRQDVLMVAGFELPGNVWEDRFNQDPPSLWLNQADGLVRLPGAAGLQGATDGKAIAVLDYDRDGDLDLVLTRNGERVSLYRNDMLPEPTLRIALDARQSVPGGYGARIQVTSPQGQRQFREMGSSSHYIAQSERVAHFGFAEAEIEHVSVRVQWPSGVVLEVACQPLGPDVVTLTEPEADRRLPCDEVGEVPDAAVEDAAVADAAVADAAVEDAAVEDAAFEDAAVEDAAVEDAAVADAAVADAAVADAAVADAAVADTAPTDAAVPADAAVEDAALTQDAAATQDAGADAAPAHVPPHADLGVDVVDGAIDSGTADSTPGVVEPGGSAKRSDCSMTYGGSGSGGALFFGIFFFFWRRRRAERA